MVVEEEGMITITCSVELRRRKAFQSRFQWSLVFIESWMSQVRRGRWRWAIALKLGMRECRRLLGVPLEVLVLFLYVGYYRAIFFLYTFHRSDKRKMSDDVDKDRHDNGQAAFLIFNMSASCQRAYCQQILSSSSSPSQ